LSENFSLPDHHRIQPRYDPKKMFGTGRPIVAIKRTGVLYFPRPALLQGMQDVFGRDRVFRGSVNFHSIARRQHQRFPASGGTA
jgi:hypothetical protein